MSERTGMLISGISLVVYGSATAIRGLVVGDLVVLVLGLCALGLVVIVELFGPPVKSPRTRRRVLALAGMYERRRRLFVISFVVFVGERAIRCIVSAAGHDWWSFVYYAVTGLAAAGMLASVVLSPIAADSEDDGDGLRGDLAAP